MNREKNWDFSIVIYYHPVTIEENALNNQREIYYNHLVNEGEK